MIWVGVGGARGFNPLQVGEKAARKAMDRLGKPKPDLVIVFSSTRMEQREMLQGVRSVAGPSPLIGCSGASQMTGDSFDEDVVVVTVVSDRFRVRTGIGRGLREDARKAGQGAAWASGRDLKEKGRFFLAFSDALSGKNDDAIRGIQEVFGTSFPIVGAAGADHFRFEKSFQYYENQVLEDSVSGALFFGELAFGIGSRHGWLPLGRPRRITRASGNTLEELEGRPAISIYEDYFGEIFHEGGEPLIRKSLFYPLGLSVGKGEWLIRQPIQIGSGGSLICTGEVSSDEEVRLMIGTKESLLEAIRQAGQSAFQGLSGKKPRLLLVFESASRKKVLGRDVSREIQILHELFGQEVPLAGFYGYGEMFPFGGEQDLGKSSFLNESVVLLVLGE